MIHVKGVDFNNYINNILYILKSATGFPRQGGTDGEGPSQFVSRNSYLSGHKRFYVQTAGRKQRGRLQNKMLHGFRIRRDRCVQISLNFAVIFPISSNLDITWSKPPPMR
jgi:hypothetical protein